MDMMSYLMGRNSGGAKKGVKIEVVTELPETGEANVIYLVPKETEDENNVFDEYIWINDEWELIGTTDIDLSNYYTKSEIDGKFPPIYVLNTTDDLSDGDKSFGNNEKNQFSTIITDAYAKGFKGIVVLLISTTSGRTYVFYSSNQITNRSFPELVTDYSQSNRGIQMQKVYIRRLYTVGSWNNDVFTCSSLSCSSVRANLLTSDNVTAYNVSNDYTPAHKKYVDDNKGQTIQYETMPTPSADYLGKIVQYIGTTDSNYTNGYFYVCVGTTENDVTTYSWSNVEVQDSASEYSANSIFINTGNRSGNNFGDIIHGNTTTSVSLNADEKGQLTEFLQSMYDGNKDMFCITIGGDYMFINENRALSMTVSPQYLTGRRLSEKPTQMTCYSAMTSCHVNNDGFMCKYCLNISLRWDGDIVSVVSAFCKCGAALGFITSNVAQRDYLRKDNTTSYTPTGNYNPATKKYVDDSIATAITTTLGGSF